MQSPGCCMPSACSLPNSFLHPEHGSDMFVCPCLLEPVLLSPVRNFVIRTRGSARCDGTRWARCLLLWQHLGEPDRKRPVTLCSTPRLQIFAFQIYWPDFVILLNPLHNLELKDSQMWLENCETRAGLVGCWRMRTRRLQKSPAYWLSHVCLPVCLSRERWQLQNCKNYFHGIWY